MRLFYSFLLSVYLLLPFFGQKDEVFFKSSLLREIELTHLEGEFTIFDDSGELIEVRAMEDEEEVLYWYRRIFTPVCLTGECFMVDVGIYWYCTGEFLGLEVYKEHLTKTDHSVFSKQDYDKLISVLSNDWSSLREYEFADLVDESEESVDGTSGATKKEIAEEAVEDAVYTTHTLWHLIHLGEKEQLVQLTTNFLNQGELFESLLKVKDQRYRNFLMELLSLGRLYSSDATNSFLVDGLNAIEDPPLRKLAIKALSHVDIEEPFIQNEIIKIYPEAPIGEKLQVLGALTGVKVVSDDLMQVLAADLYHPNEWFVIRLLDVLKNVQSESELLLTSVKDLLGNENAMVKKAAEEFLRAKKL